MSCDITMIVQDVQETVCLEVAALEEARTWPVGDFRQGPPGGPGPPGPPGGLASSVFNQAPVELADGARTSFTTGIPYEANTLTVTVTGSFIPRDYYTETDPDAGAFELAWAPDPGEPLTFNLIRKEA